MLGALNDTPFVDKPKLLSIVFLWGNKNYKIKILQPAPYFLVTMDDNLLIKLTWPKMYFFFLSTIRIMVKA
jgi:hypothetical protein